MNNLLCQLPILEALIPLLKPEDIKSLGLVNKRIQNYKNNIVTHLTITDIPDFEYNLNFDKYPNLNSIYFKNTNEEHVPDLTLYPKIKRLKLANYLFYFILVHFGSSIFTHIEELDLSTSFYLDTCFSHLNTLPNLIKLNISNYDSIRYDKILRILLQLPKLEILIMNNIIRKLPLKSFKKYLPKSKLKILDVRNAHFLPGIKDIFNQCPHIKIITN